MIRRPVRAVIVDVDGTLVDSNDAHARAWVEELTEGGHPVALDAVRRLIGMGGDELLPAAAGLTEDSPEGERISRRRGEIYATRYLPGLRAFPGVSELLRRMRDRGLRLAVASSAKEEELAPLLRIAGADWLIDAAASSDDAERSKPDPDIVQAALAKTRSEPADTLMLGDTPYDLEAARRAGIEMIGLRCGGWNDVALRSAVAVFDDAADLLERYDASPLGGSDTPEHLRRG